MRRVPFVAVALWAAATVLATAACWAGVAAVTTDVTGDHGVALPPARVAELATAVDDAPAMTTTTSTTVASAPSTTPARPTPSTTVPPVVAAEIPSTTTTTVAPASQSATFADEGGVITVACDGEVISLASARPSDGYRIEVREAGPDRVKVAFEADVDRSVLAARCMDGVPTRVESAAPRPHRARPFNGVGSEPPPDPYQPRT